jgi:hypothetical protein
MSDNSAFAELLRRIRAGDARAPEEQVRRYEPAIRLTPEERELAHRRGAGQGWAEIAAALGGTADGRRIQLRRAIDRVAPALGLVDDGEGDADA